MIKYKGYNYITSKGRMFVVKVKVSVYCGVDAYFINIIYADEAVFAFHTRCRQFVDSVHSSLILLVLRDFLRFESRLSLL